MPQLDVTTYAPQVVWLVITFLAMYFLMATAHCPSFRRTSNTYRR